MSILEITIKKQLSTWKGTRVLVPGHQNSGAPTIFLVFSWLCILNFCWQYSDITKKCQGHINTLEKKDKLIFLMSILEITIKNSCQLERAPEFWCPGTRAQEHINTLRKKEKLIFLKPILDIKTKTCWSSWKGTKVLVPPAFLAGLSWKNMPTNAGNVSIKPGNIRNTIVCLAKKVNLTYLIPIFNIYTITGAERAPEFWCPLFLHG